MMKTLLPENYTTDEFCDSWKTSNEVEFPFSWEANESRKIVQSIPFFFFLFFFFFSPNARSTYLTLLVYYNNGEYKLGKFCKKFSYSTKPNEPAT